jgi:hypothetical protein
MRSERRHALTASPGAAAADPAPFPATGTYLPDCFGAGQIASQTASGVALMKILQTTRVVARCDMVAMVSPPVIGSDLIVEIPWIVFGLLLAAVCLRLRRFRRFSGRERDRESQPPSGDGNDSSAIADEPAGNDHNGAAVSAPTRASQTQP